MSSDEALTRASWDCATTLHNAHKGDQVAFFKGGGDVLFPEELALLGPLDGKRVVHLQCNSGQDTLGLARRGAHVVGVDFSGVAIAFAKDLSARTGLAATFVEAELLGWLATSAPAAFEVAFTSYGAVGWLPSLDSWANGVFRVLEPGGRLVLVEFHPLIWSIDKSGALGGDDYFQTAPFRAPVNDYVAESGAGLGASPGSAVQTNTIPATSFQYGIGQVVSALAAAGFVLQRLVEYPFSNGYKANARLVEAPGRRWEWPAGMARVPLMYGLEARKPASR